MRFLIFVRIWRLRLTVLYPSWSICLALFTKSRLTTEMLLCRARPTIGASVYLCCRLDFQTLMHKRTMPIQHAALEAIPTPSTPASTCCHLWLASMAYRKPEQHSTTRTSSKLGKICGQLSAIQEPRRATNQIVDGIWLGYSRTPRLGNVESTALRQGSFRSQLLT